MFCYCTWLNKKYFGSLRALVWFSTTMHYQVLVFSLNSAQFHSAAFYSYFLFSNSWFSITPWPNKFIIDCITWHAKTIAVFLSPSFRVTHLSNSSFRPSPVHGEAAYVINSCTAGHNNCYPDAHLLLESYSILTSPITFSFFSPCFYSGY